MFIEIKTDKRGVKREIVNADRIIKVVFHKNDSQNYDVVFLLITGESITETYYTQRDAEARFREIVGRLDEKKYLYGDGKVIPVP